MIRGCLFDLTMSIERLDEIRLALEQYRSAGLTEKNRLIRQIATFSAAGRYQQIVDELMSD